MLWKEKERSRIRDVQMDNIRGLLIIRRMDRVLNARVRELCGVKNDLDERIDEEVLRWFGHVERMERLQKEPVLESALVVIQCVGHGRDGLIQRRSG